MPAVCDGLGLLKFPGRIGFDLGLVYGYGYVFVLDVEAQAVEETHVDIGNPDEGEPGDEIAAPAFVEHLKARDYQKKGGDVVAEAVFAREEVKEFARDEAAAVLALVFAPVARFAEDLFMGDGPCDACDRKGKNEEIGELALKSHEHN